MEQQSPLEEAISLIKLGKLRKAIAILDGCLLGNPAIPLQERAKIQLYLGAACRALGDGERAEEILARLAEDSWVAQPWRAYSWIELSILRRKAGRFQEAFRLLDRAREELDVGHVPGRDLDMDRLYGHFHNTFGQLLYQVQRFTEAEEEYRRAASIYTILGSPHIVGCQLNLANVSILLGRRRQAEKHLKLARSAMMDLGPANAFGLVQFFEILATFSLFVYGSEQRAIDALMEISEEVVTDLGDFRKVFDFFGSIIVQRHEGRFDLDAIRRLVEDYGDDPLIKAYLPSLLTGCPPPGNADGNEAEDDLGGGGEELDRLEEMGDEETEEEGAEGGDEDEEIKEDEENEDGEDDEDDETAMRGRE